MTTSVLFLDDASRHVGSIDRRHAEDIVIELLTTLKQLRKVSKLFALNTIRPIAQYQIADNWTLQAILGGPEYRDEWNFIRLLNDRSPFAARFEEGLAQEVADLEFRTVGSQILSSALAWAKLMDSATVSFNGHIDWSQAWVDTVYSALDEEGGLSTTQTQVRNASKVGHATVHIDWLKSLGLSNAPAALQLWNERVDRYPGLRFLPRMEKDLLELESSGLPFMQAVSALEALAKDHANWKPDQPWPDFSTKATPESNSRQAYCWTNDEATGRPELFDWHTRFTGGLAGRVHFRVDSANRSIVVAYVGSKLTRGIPA